MYWAPNMVIINFAIPALCGLKPHKAWPDTISAASKCVGAMVIDYVIIAFHPHNFDSV